MHDKLGINAMATKIQGFRSVLKQLVLELKNNIFDIDDVEIVKLLIKVYNSYSKNPDSEYIRKFKELAGGRTKYELPSYYSRPQYYMPQYYYEPKPVCQDTLKKVKDEGERRLGRVLEDRWYSMELQDISKEDREKSRQKRERSNERRKSLRILREQEEVKKKREKEEAKKKEEGVGAEGGLGERIRGTRLTQFYSSGGIGLDTEIDEIESGVIEEKGSEKIGYNEEYKKEEERIEREEIREREGIGEGIEEEVVLAEEVVMAEEVGEELNEEFDYNKYGILGKFNGLGGYLGNSIAAEVD